MVFRQDRIADYAQTSPSNCPSGLFVDKEARGMLKEMAEAVAKYFPLRGRCLPAQDVAFRVTRQEGPGVDDEVSWQAPADWLREAAAYVFSHGRMRGCCTPTRSCKDG